MSVSQLARAGRFDSAANSAAQKASNLNSQLNSMCDEVLAFAAFMHTDPRNEFSQADRDKYSADFAQSLGALHATLAKLDVLAGIEAGSVTVEQFLASYTGNPEEYSARFDKG